MIKWYTIPVVRDDTPGAIPRLPFEPVGSTHMILDDDIYYVTFSRSTDEQRAIRVPGARRLGKADIESANVRLPIPYLAVMTEQIESARRIGLGDTVSWFTRKLGIEECEGCSQRRKRLNRIRLWPLRG